ncbi:hypothetical protein SYNPS1DRAFT_8347, partial [Syncephalis pseudoplumigaleata]
VPYHALLVVSLSTTSDDPAADPAQARVTKDNAEIIDIAWSVLNTANLSVSPVKHVPIKPVDTPVTQHCTTQTGITEADLVEAGNFAAAIDALEFFVKESLAGQQLSFCLCTQDAWAFNAQLKSEAARKEVTLPASLRNPSIFDLKQELAKWSADHATAPLAAVELDDLAAVAGALGLQTPDKIASALEHCAVMAAIVRHMLTHDQGTSFRRPIDTGADLEQFKAEQSRVVYLCGLPENCTQPELHGWLAQAGCPPETLWMICGAEGRASGSGFAIARTHEEALQMVTLNGQQLRNRVVDVSPSNEHVLEAARGMTGPFPVAGGHAGYASGAMAMHGRPGDWACPSCQFHNFATRQYCLKCQTPAPAGASTPGGRHPHDWTCPNAHCGFLNYASRSQCLRCGSYRPDVPVVASGYAMPHGGYAGPAGNGGMMGGPGGAAHGFRPGDWICPNPNCYFQNFASRTACYRCHTPNP